MFAATCALLSDSRLPNTLNSLSTCLCYMLDAQLLPVTHISVCELMALPCWVAWCDALRESLLLVRRCSFLMGSWTPSTIVFCYVLLFVGLLFAVWGFGCYFFSQHTRPVSSSRKMRRLMHQHGSFPVSSKAQYNCPRCLSVAWSIILVIPSGLKPGSKAWILDTSS